MKVSKELKVGLSVVLATALLILGMNFLKGSSFFGGDDIYYAYFPEASSLQPSSAVTLNGVEIGRVMAISLNTKNLHGDPNKRVVVSFTLLAKDFKIAKGSSLTIVPGLLSTELQLNNNFEELSHFYAVGDTLEGTVSQELTQQLETQLVPVKRKLEDLMVSIENIVNTITIFWDTSAAYTLDQGLNEAKIAISRFGNVAYNLDELITSEKVKLGNIFSNVEDITKNFKETNMEIKRVVGNVGQITDTLLTSDFKKVISEATHTLEKINLALSDAAEGKGTLGKLLKDDQLYEELNRTTQKVQELVDDIKIHPERYIHFSVFGKKNKGVPLTKDEEIKLRGFLDTLNTKK